MGITLFTNENNYIMETNMFTKGDMWMGQEILEFSGLLSRPVYKTENKDLLHSTRNDT